MNPIQVVPKSTLKSNPVLFCNLDKFIPTNTSMNTYKIEESPMIQQIGFSKLLSKYDEMARNGSRWDIKKAQSMLPPNFRTDN
jgi:hypothetical protein